MHVCHLSDKVLTDPAVFHVCVWSSRCSTAPRASQKQNMCSFVWEITRAFIANEITPQSRFISCLLMATLFSSHVIENGHCLTREILQQSCALLYFIELLLGLRSKTVTPTVKFLYIIIVTGNLFCSLSCLFFFFARFLTYLTFLPYLLWLNQAWITQTCGFH